MCRPTCSTNAELARMVDTSDAWITERTGIKERHILKGKGLGTSHMGARGRARAPDKTGTKPGEVDLLICATTTPDFVFPSSANLICDMCGIRVDRQFRRPGGLFRLSSMRSPSPRNSSRPGNTARSSSSAPTRCRRSSTTPIARPACCSATVPARCCSSRASKYGIIDTLIRSDGSGMPHLHQKAGGSRMPPTRGNRGQAPALRPSGRRRGLQIRRRAHGGSRERTDEAQSV